MALVTLVVQVCLCTRCDSLPKNMEDFVWDSEQEGNLAFELEENLELDDVPENRVTLAGLLVADHEPPLAVVKEVLRAAWSNMGYVRVVK